MNSKDIVTANFKDFRRTRIIKRIEKIETKEM
jgi:hypothetical protein